MGFSRNSKSILYASEAASIVNNLSSARCGLLAIDLQNAFLDSNGLLPVPGGLNTMPRLGPLISEFRERSVKIIWTRSSHEFASESYREFCPSHFRKGREILGKNNWNFSFHPDILQWQNPSQDWFLVKDRYSAFIGTSLEDDLRREHIDTLFFTGVMTNVCVESSLRDAFQLGFRSILVKDCTATLSSALQAASEEVIQAAFGYVICSDQIGDWFEVF